MCIYNYMPCIPVRPSCQDSYWASHGENDKSKAAKKREEEERKRAETAAKKAEAKRLADAELEELGRAKARAEKAGSQKVGRVPVVLLLVWYRVAAWRRPDAVPPSMASLSLPSPLPLLLSSVHTLAQPPLWASVTTAATQRHTLRITPCNRFSAPCTGDPLPAAASST